MKTKYLLFAVATLLSIECIGQTNNSRSVFGINLPSSSSGFKTHKPFNTIPFKTLDWDSVRPLTEINDTTTTDSYPHLSSDGLRLYLTKGDPSRIYFTSRPDLDSPFDPPTLLDPNLPDSVINCWLSADELEIFFILNTLYSPLFYASRSSTTSQFSTPYEVHFTIPGKPYRAGVSFTSDKEQMLVGGLYYDLSGTIEINTYLFQRVDSANYTLIDSLNVPSGYLVSPGQFSKDGLKAYISLSEDPFTGVLYRMDRPDFNTPFGNLQMLSQTINDTNFSYHGQASLSADEQTMIFVQNNVGDWANNNVYISKASSAGMQTHKNEPSLKVFPNPSSGILNIELSNNQNCRLEVCSILGQKLVERDLSNSMNKLDLSYLPKGMYVIYVIQNGTFNQCNWVKL